MERTSIFSRAEGYTNGMNGLEFIESYFTLERSLRITHPSTCTFLNYL